MKNKKGFTLIELLAVIVILAIIALIAVPIVLNIINNTKESSAIRSTEIYFDSVEKTIVAKQLSKESNVAGTYEIKEGNLYQEDELKYEIKMKGTKPTGESITINKTGKIENAKIIIDGYLFNYSDGKLSRSLRVSSTTNEVVLDKSKESNLIDLKIYGNSVQNGTPTPSNPIEVESVGDKTDQLLNIPDRDEYVDYYGINVKIENNIAYLSDVNNDGPVSLWGGYTNTKTLFELQPGTYTSNVTLRSYDGTNRPSYNGTFTLSDTLRVTDVAIGTKKGKSGANYIMLSSGSTKKEYEPYGKYKIPIKITNKNKESQIINIFLNEPLRKIGDSVDYIDFKNKKVTRNVTMLKLDGSNGIGFKNNTVWHINLSKYANELMNGRKFKKYNDIFSVQYRGLSNMFAVQCYNYNNTSLDKIFLSASGEFMSIPLGLFETEDRDGFIKYFKTNPTYLLGEVEETYEEDIELPELKSFEDYTKIEILTETTPSKIDVEFLKK